MADVSAAMMAAAFRRSAAAGFRRHWRYFHDISLMISFADTPPPTHIDFDID
jgi:hypothetical protein